MSDKPFLLLLLAQIFVNHHSLVKREKLKVEHFKYRRSMECYFESFLIAGALNVYFPNKN